MKPLYRVKIYARGPGKRLLLETTHTTEVSKVAEVAAARARQKRGEVGPIEVFKCGEDVLVETL